MKKILYVFLIFISFDINAQTIPDSVLVNWHHAGFEGVIPEYSTVVNVTTYGAIPNDTIDDRNAVVSAISALGGNAGIIYFPPGQFIMHASINLPDSVVLRGAGSDSTTFIFDFGNNIGNCINISAGVSNSFMPILSGYNKNSNEILVAGADTVFGAGDEIEIREANGAWDTNPAVWADFSAGHLSRVDSVRGDSIWMHEGLRMDFDPSLNPEIRKIVTRKNCGLECFKMIRTDSTATSVNYGVNFSFASNCWMRGVESQKSICSHVALETSMHIEISGCYFHESYIYDGASTHGYGIVIFTHSCSNKIEDNIFRLLRHAMITKQGANGNVFGYNYSRETNRSEAIADYAADICLHGHYAFGNLYEGNIAQNLQVDQAWGPSGPFNTFFRNKIENYGIIMSSGTVESDRQNFIGNDASNMTLFHGLYSLAGANHVEFGNNIRGTITPNGTGNLTDTSFYLDSIPPAFWNITASLPAIGIPNGFTDDTNPALERYNNGGALTLCGFAPDTMDTTVVTHSPQPDRSTGMSCFSTPENVIVIIQNDKAETGMIRLFDITGQCIYSEKAILKSERSVISIPRTGIHAGMYLVTFSASGVSCSEKLVLEN